MPGRPYHDRREAGRYLAEKLADYAGRPDGLVLALPRGGVPGAYGVARGLGAPLDVFLGRKPGVPVAYEFARPLGAPLDVFLVRKLGVPGHEELALGAIATGGVRPLNADVVRGLGIPPDIIDQVTATERAELERREPEYRGDR